MAGEERRREGGRQGATAAGEGGLYFSALSPLSRTHTPAPHQRYFAAIVQQLFDMTWGRTDGDGR